MVFPAGQDVNVALVREQHRDRNNKFVSEIDRIRGVMNARVDFGAGGQAATAAVTLATAAPGATRGRVVAMILYAAAATSYVFTDNAAAIFATIYASGQSTTYISKEQLGEGGIIFTTDFTIDPNANGSVAWVAWIPEYDTVE